METIETPEIHNLNGVGAVMIEAFPTGNRIIYNAVLGEFSRAAMTKSDALAMVLADARNASQIKRENF